MQLSNDGIFFAVKELKVKEVVTTAPEEALNNEVLTLKRFNDKRHDHLIRLFATYTYQGRINMIFPWADGNLEDFWKTPKAQTSQRSTASETVWMSQQIWGLCRALQSIHVCEMDSDDESRNLPEAAYQKIYGRHGDLKPENILWFRSIQNSQGEQSFDVLQIADFGFADFHGPDSKSNVRLSRIPGFTDSYKAPEFEGNKHVSPSYDIWSLGCILSQFAFWWMRGWDGVDDFSEERATEAPDPITKIPTDIFYKVQHGKISLKKTVALVSKFAHDDMQQG
ncbi:hypothetical protein SLS59_004804 [Nothophoma quercina]|uniref:Protein kinase domain-containing protein n=1 Tax=Nothophoma quercina TaxID=749835 RepID=A0ABR3RCH2_9PLEO